MLTKFTNQILETLPKELLMSPEEISIINKHSDFIISLSNDIVKMFYDTVFGFEGTKKIFHDGERPIREKSLSDWITKTVKGDFNQKYWEWQTFVGILHIKRKVDNNIMITMLSAISKMLIKESINNLEKDEAIELLEAWTKLSSLITSLITESFRLFYLHAIVETTGMSELLLQNTVDSEIDNLVKQNESARM